MLPVGLESVEVAPGARLAAGLRKVLTEVEVAEVRIRPVTEKDVSLMLALIKELAKYEQMADRVTATEEDLHVALFGPTPSAEAVLAVVGDTPVGYALFFHSFSTFLAKPGLYLEDLYVRPEFRGRGFGRRLLVYLARLARDQGCGRVEWSVLNWNELALRAYQLVGAVAQNEWTTYRLTGDALDRLADEGD